MQKITPFLWFDNNLEEALEFYTSVFKNSKVLNITHLPDGTPGPKGNVLTATFQLEGQEFMALNGGPGHPLTDAISLMVKCDTQAEIDYYWNKLTANGGQEVACGWLKDKFGLSWQIAPPMLLELIRDPDPVKAGRVMQAMMKMVKLDIAVLKAASEG
jgi:predicted 3-demethylubiquinone-9 3-methyltransferase (glyoxalase superfamily)